MNNKEILKEIREMSGQQRRQISYAIKNYAGELKCDGESKVQQFFNIDNLPESQHDADLIQAYAQSLK